MTGNLIDSSTDHTVRQSGGLARPFRYRNKTFTI